GRSIISPYEEKGFRGPVTDVRIRFVNKTGRTSADDRIHYFGGINADGAMEIDAGGGDCRDRRRQMEVLDGSTRLGDEAGLMPFFFHTARFSKKMCNFRPSAGDWLGGRTNWRISSSRLC
ncbi:MAG: hypothetical protein WB715_00765, partial [Roseiarcus sp.]|uniref:hypothetical protein n=1 Tax=Roseiarcus sp. TaxID=1969460 RepID=UPI003C5ECAF0